MLISPSNIFCAVFISRIRGCPRGCPRYPLAHAQIAELIKKRGRRWIVPYTCAMTFHTISAVKT